MRERPYQKLIAWQESHVLCKWVYEITKQYPSEERFRLISQMCRSAYSAPMNIAEGSSKKSKKERARFYEIAFASVEELHYQFLLSKDLQYITETCFQQADQRISKTSYLLRKLYVSCL